MMEAYRTAGVDVKKGDRFVDFIKGISSPAVSTGLGGFSGGFELDTDRYRHPMIMTATDGVGTKLLIAQRLEVYDTLGIDLVAMCVNDLIASGAEPVSFLDYIACGSIQESVMQDLIIGIVNGCEQAECTLSGGETAEMPDVYGERDFDLAGFAVGVVEREKALPRTESIAVGTQLLGMPSAGIHSNGLSLARKVLPLDDHDILQELLKPTVIYVRALKELLTTESILGIAHITGGGLLGNVGRILPDNLSFHLTYGWEQPWIFQEIQRIGKIETDEMKGVFNLGIGMVLAVQSESVDALMAHAAASEIDLVHVGEVAAADLF